MYFLLPCRSSRNGSPPVDCIGGGNGKHLIVWKAVCEESRLEKERSAVLSELTMVHTIAYPNPSI